MPVFNWWERNDLSYDYNSNAINQAIPYCVCKQSFLEQRCYEIVPLKKAAIDEGR